MADFKIKNYKFKKVNLITRECDTAIDQTLCNYVIDPYSLS